MMQNNANKYKGITLGTTNSTFKCFLLHYFSLPKIRKSMNIVIIRKQKQNKVVLIQHLIKFMLKFELVQTDKHSIIILLRPKNLRFLSRTNLIKIRCLQFLSKTVTNQIVICLY